MIEKQMIEKQPPPCAHCSGPNGKPRGAGIRICDKCWSGTIFWGERLTLLSSAKRNRIREVQKIGRGKRPGGAWDWKFS